MSLSPEAASAQALLVARTAYGRLLAWLAWQWRDIAAAEDALGDAFAAALVHWPRSGIPAAPEAWLLTTAKRQLLKAARRQRLADDPAVVALLAQEDIMPTKSELADPRLRLMLVCAHPAIDRGIRSALMLQTVLGLEAGYIARAFVISAEAMSKRLVRAKSKIKLAGIRFEEPDRESLPARVDDVLDAIYGAYTLDWDRTGPPQAESLSSEALYLARVVAAELPNDPEVLGLLALLMFCEARKPARYDDHGVFVPLHMQDTALWGTSLIDEANQWLSQAASYRSTGPYQIEAAIQSAHCNRKSSGVTPWVDIARLYGILLNHHAGIGARLGHAIALAMSMGDVDASLKLLDEIPQAQAVNHQPWWATRAYLLSLKSSKDPSSKSQARSAFARTLQLTNKPALRGYLLAQLQALDSS